MHARGLNDLSGAVMDAAPYLVVVSDLRTDAVVRINRLASQVTGLAEDQVLGRSLWETVLGPGDRPALEAAVAAPGGALGHDTTLRDAAGGERRVMWSISFLEDEQGRREHLVLTGVDVTPASGSCGLLSHVMRDAVAAALVGTDAAGRVTFCNPAAEAMLGYPAPLLLGRPLPASIFTPSELEERATKLGVPADLRVLAADLSRLDRRRRDVRLGALDRRGRRDGTAQDRGRGQRRPRSYDWTLVRADGSRFTAAVAVTTLSDATGRPTGYLASAEDVTEQRRSRNLLLAGLEREVEAVRRLEALDRAKTDFVATVSHELRTPITNISGYAELLLGGHGGTLSDTQATMLDAIQRSGARLGALADNLLTLSSFEAGEFSLVPEDVDLRAVVEEAETAVRPLIADRRIDTTFVVPEQPVVVCGDARHLTRVVLNLLTNALKFTEDDGMVACTLGTEAGQAVLRVSDTGIGIPEDEQDRLFTNFFRSSTAQARAIQGIGLGLSVVETIVRRHGGEISVVSGHLRGSTFTVRLPLAGASVRGEAWAAREGAA
jgi:PAS domain S-box-containing protein